jgi:hypothetical protein
MNIASTYSAFHPMKQSRMGHNDPFPGNPSALPLFYCFTFLTSYILNAKRTNTYTQTLIHNTQYNGNSSVPLTEN